MTIDAYLDELKAALRVRGAARRRFLSECREHLVDAAGEGGEAAAVEAFGPADALAAAFDAEVAVTRGVRATALTAAGVVATGGSTLAVIHASSSSPAAPPVWTAVFFIAAQLAAVALALAFAQALVTRRAGASAAELMLLARRDACALVASGVTMFAAGAAVPGQGSAPLLLAGPLLAIAALVAVARARALTRRLDGARLPVVRPPLADLAALARLPLGSIGAARLLPPTVVLAAVAAFVRDRADEHATASGALLTATVEGAAVIACLLVFGRILGLTGRLTR
jgi:hypothetical protein